jgi:hypothetical protein
MKKSILFSLFGLVGATSIMAANYDLYINGSTAFRANAFGACKALYDGGSYSSANNGTGSPSSSDSRWTMTGTAVNLGLTSGSDTLTIHALWNGSVQGISSLANKDQLVFLASATPGNTTLKTNTSSCALSDVYSAPTLFPLSSGSFTEKEVCVQPFVMVKSVAPGGVLSITNVTWQQLVTMFGSSGGSSPLSYFTGRASDATTNIYFVYRTLDSGTRVTMVQEAQYIGGITVTYYDPSSDTYLPATTNRGPAIFGPGYVGGGDVKSVLQTNTPGNQAISFLSIADAKGITGTAWEKMLAFNGNYPIAGFVPGVAPTAPYDYSPLIYGKYDLWAFEVLDWPKSGQWGTYSDQNLSFTQLNNIMGKLSAHGNTPGVAGPTGSIDNDIFNAQAAGANAVRLCEINVSRPAVGGPISP